MQLLIFFPRRKNRHRKTNLPTSRPRPPQRPNLNRKTCIFFAQVGAPRGEDDISPYFSEDVGSGLDRRSITIWDYHYCSAGVFNQHKKHIRLSESSRRSRLQGYQNLSLLTQVCLKKRLQLPSNFNRPGEPPNKSL